MNLKASRRTHATSLLKTAEHAPFEDGALDELVPLIYDELREMAHRQLARERRPATLQTTALVHEVYLRLVDDEFVGRRGRAYFFAAVARAMRQILVDRARRRLALKRGGGADIVTLEENHASVDSYATELVEIDDALRRLGQRSSRQVRVVEHRFFAGLNVEETAALLDVSARTVESDWAMARAWLFRALHPEPEPRANGGAP